MEFFPILQNTRSMGENEIKAIVTPSLEFVQRQDPFGTFLSQLDESNSHPFIRVCTVIFQ